MNADLGQGVVGAWKKNWFGIIAHAEASGDFPRAAAA